MCIQRDLAYEETVWIWNCITWHKIYLGEHSWRYLWRPGLRDRTEDFYIFYLMYCLNCFKMNVLVKRFKLKYKALRKGRRQKIMALFHWGHTVNKVLFMCHVLIKLLQEHYKVYVSTETSWCMMSLKHKKIFNYISKSMFEEKFQLQVLTIGIREG